jgi:three-Cys-motif partner protein
MAQRDPGRYTQGDDGLIAEKVGSWAVDKLKIVTDSVYASGVRFTGPASVAMPKIVQSLNRHGLHLAFLDPYNLGALSFDLFVELAKLKRIDVIAHVSLHDLQRNAGRYTSEAHDEFDKFAPGWREKVGTNMNQETLRAALIQYWSDKVMALGLPRARHWELIKGDHGQRLYWSILLARNDLAHDLWERISSAAKAPTFDF